MTSSEINEGDIVLVGADKNRLEWPLTRAVEIIALAQITKSGRQNLDV